MKRGDELSEDAAVSREFDAIMQRAGQGLRDGGGKETDEPIVPQQAEAPRPDPNSRFDEMRVSSGSSTSEDSDRYNPAAVETVTDTAATTVTPEPVTEAPAETETVAVSRLEVDSEKLTTTAAPGFFSRV